MGVLIAPFLLLTACILIPLICIGVVSCIVFGDVDIDSQYYNADGDHIYYERSLIEKKMFRKRYPHAEIRKLSNMFKRRGRVAQV